MKKLLKKILRKALPSNEVVTNIQDEVYLAPDVPMSKLASHQKWQAYIYDLANKPGMRVLEIGSREVCGPSDARNQFANAEYVGFDYYPGDNVDVVGDVHKLSSYFQADEKFDLIYTSACFEHFAMPWIVATEIAKVLKVGGTLLIETHFSFSSHERPWHFFQFSDMALKVLFSEALGFECIEAGLSNPIVGRFSSLADEYLRHRPVTGLYCHSEYLGKKVRDVEDFRWEQVDLSNVVSGTHYPEPVAKG
ncbi:MAG: class I SAM-dependent methyltransferase [Cyanobacteria bacterium P01_C01_bin.147]